MPAYNCSEYIRRAITTVPSFVDHLIIINDASTDNTHAVAKRCLREDSRSGGSLAKKQIVKHQVNRGVGAAICSGYVASLESEADIICVMAGDAQMDPDDLEHVIEPIVKGRADYVKGNRYASNQHIPKRRQIGTMVLTALTRLSSGYAHIHDSQCGYTAISRAMLKQLDLEKIFDRYGYPNDMLAKLHIHQARVAEVPIKAVYDQQPTGIKWTTVVHPIGTRLGYSWANRIYSERRQRIKRPLSSVKQGNHSARSSECK